MTLIRNEKTVNILSLLASTSTLICCAIPAFFVFLGAGATLASLVTTFPFLISLSSYKTSITITTFLILLIVGYLNYRTYYLHFVVAFVAVAFAIAGHIVPELAIVVAAL